MSGKRTVVDGLGYSIAPATTRETYVPPAVPAAPLTPEQFAKKTEVSGTVQATNGISANWRGRMMCIGSDVEVFYPDNANDPEQAEEAKAICDNCEVREECLESALARRDPDGIQGGLMPIERSRILRQRGKGTRPRRKK